VIIQMWRAWMMCPAFVRTRTPCWTRSSVTRRNITRPFPAGQHTSSRGWRNCLASVSSQGTCWRRTRLQDASQLTACCMNCSREMLNCTDSINHCCRYCCCRYFDTLVDVFPRELKTGIHSGGSRVSTPSFRVSWGYFDTFYKKVTS